MVREDILGGLRTALARGQTLRQAMMSFYNAGYIKEEIEEAAKALQAERNQPLQPQFAQGLSQEAPIFQRTTSIEKDPNEEPKEVLSQTAKLTQPTQQPQTIQKVSAYGQPQQTQPVQPPQVQQQPQTIQKVSAYGQPVQQTTQPQPIQQPIQQIPQVQQPQTIQKVSAYGQPPQVQQPQAAKPRGKAIIFILLALLIILVGGLIAVFFFKEEILSFLE